MWIYYAVGSVIFFTVLNLLQRKLSINSKNPRAMAVIFNSFAAIFAILIFLSNQSYSNFQFPDSSAAWTVVIIASLLYALFERGRFYVAKVLDASVFSTIIVLPDLNM